jgi:hypothetical protein
LLTDAEYAAITSLIRRAIEQNKFPRAPRLDPLRSALAKLLVALMDGPERRVQCVKFSKGGHGLAGLSGLGGGWLS